MPLSSVHIPWSAIQAISSNPMLRELVNIVIQLLGHTRATTTTKLRLQFELKIKPFFIWHWCTGPVCLPGNCCPNKWQLCGGGSFYDYYYSWLLLGRSGSVSLMGWKVVDALQFAATCRHPSSCSIVKYHSSTAEPLFAHQLHLFTIRVLRCVILVQSTAQHGALIA